MTKCGSEKTHFVCKVENVFANVLVVWTLCCVCVVRCVERLCGCVCVRCVCVRVYVCTVWSAPVCRSKTHVYIPNVSVCPNENVHMFRDVLDLTSKWTSVVNALAPEVHLKETTECT